MRKVELGDIVKLKDRYGNDGLDGAYYIITDYADFTEESDEQPDVDCEMMQVYPALETPEIAIIHIEKIEIVCANGDAEYEIMLKHIAKDRERNGWYDEPEYFAYLKTNGTPEYRKLLNEIIQGGNATPLLNKRSWYKQDGTRFKTNTSTKNNNVKQEYNEKDIAEILADETSQNQIEVYTERLDNHLDLLHKAILENDAGQIDLQKSKLEEVRRTLMELEYFTLNKRRSGTSINIK